MVLIFTKKGEHSTKIVQEWLSYYKVEFIRFNSDVDTIEINEINLNNGVIYFSINNSKIYSTDDINSVWFRDGYIGLKNRVVSFPPNFYESLEGAIKYYKSCYFDYLRNYFFYILSLKSKMLGSDGQGEFNKLIALSYAMSVGLKIPNTKLFASKNNLSSFIENNLVITKSIGLNFDYVDNEENIWYHGYTSSITKHDIEKINERFELSLFQSKIIKQYEIRVVVVGSQSFSMAIFSQQNNKTDVDYRRYDKEIPNRVVPIEIPSVTKNKIFELMKKCNLTTASVDLILDTKGEYYFLEVNPIGQFDYVSGICNFNIEKHIANYLIGRDE